MNETVDSVYRFVSDQSSSAYNKMNSFVASLRRRFDKVLTANANTTSMHSSSQAKNDGEILLLNEVITDAYFMLAMTNNDNEDLKNCLHAAENFQKQQTYSPTAARRLINEIRSLISLSHSDENYLPNVKIDQIRKPEKNFNVYDTLNKHRPSVRSNPNVNNVNKNEAGKPVSMQRYSLRSSMRNLIKRRSTKVPSKKILGSSNDPEAPHLYESLDTPSPDPSPTNNSTTNEQVFNFPPRLKSSYILPSSIVALDHFTTNLYLVVNSTLNQLLVVFGSTKIHTIKLYDTNGRKMNPNDLILQYKFEDLHGYKLLSSALNNNSQNCLVVNEIRVYVSESSDDLTPTQTLKQRLLFFDQNGNFVSTSKRLPIVNELLFVEVDRTTPSIYAYDGLNLINLDRNWSINVENINCIASGSTFLVCLHTKTNQISIYNNQTGSFVYRWLITAPNIYYLQTVYLCVSRHDLIYVLVWNCDVHPVNNLVLVFDQEGQLCREYYMPNRVIPNIHAAYTYDMTLGGGHHTPNSLGNVIRRPSRKPDSSSIAWMQQQAMWNASGSHPQMWSTNSASQSPMSPFYRGMGSPYEMYHHQQQQSAQDDITLFHARFIAITDDDTLILSNIVDLGFDEETQETALVNVSRKILFFHLDT
ncbi:unnamed protein product [Rotaria magnacalcarata]|uniref:Uncharacterized protein n=2 Tax=Rotaria magnacalcarata TaxID=392030 RepID=A0A816B324_9BILA|nr:unnamed protein product [Rotaria magnacalcarata]CAF1673570.1 unnamed protein product [Rotaria magnacalcarata]